MGGIVKKLLIILALCLCATFTFSQVTDNPSEMFPQVESVGNIAHFNGDTALQSATLYAMRNASHYYDAYLALIAYHNTVAKDATLLAEVNAVLTQNAKNEKERIAQASTKWFLIGVVASAAAIGTVALVSRR